MFTPVNAHEVFIIYYDMIQYLLYLTVARRYRSWLKLQARAFHLSTIFPLSYDCTSMIVFSFSLLSFLPSFFLSIMVLRFYLLFGFTVDWGKTPSSLPTQDLRAGVRASVFCFCLSLIAFLFLIFFPSPWGRERDTGNPEMAFSCIHVYVLCMGIYTYDR